MNDRPALRRVLVVFGGRSSEHGISCVSAGSVLSAIDRSAFDVVAVGITRDGVWVPADSDGQVWRLRDGRTPEVVAGESTLSLHRADGSVRLIERFADGRCVEGPVIDVAFPVLHGRYGEDGTIQGLFESLGVPYVGSGVLASAAAMDKGAMKAALAAAGLPMGPYERVSGREWREQSAAVEQRLQHTLTLPVFVKPARAGSSMGISKVVRWTELPDAIAHAHDHDVDVVVEQGIEGREIECGVIAGDVTDAAQASAPAEIEIVGDHAFYDYAAKYFDDAAVKLHVPALLDSHVADRIRALAIRAYYALGCEGLARVDFFLEPHGTVLINEINTMPGFTPTSMFPRMWAEAGVDYPELIRRLLDDAMTRVSAGTR